jgi:hypothetical protein
LVLSDLPWSGSLSRLCTADLERSNLAGEILAVEANRA